MRFPAAMFGALFVYVILTRIAMSVLFATIPVDAVVFIASFNFIVCMFIYKMLRKW